MKPSRILAQLKLILALAPIMPVWAQPVATQAIASSTLTVDVAATAFTPVAASGGTAPYVFTALPPVPSGLSLNAATGAISGTPALANLTPVFAGHDDFNTGSPAKWSYDFRLGGATNGTLAFSSARLDFTKGAGAGNHFRGWDSDPATSAHTAPASFSRSWIAEISVTNNFATAGEFASIGFEVTDAQGNFAALMLSGGGGVMFIRAEDNGAPTEVSAGANRTNVRLRLAWDAGSKILSAHYSFDAGATFTQLKTFTPATSWSGGTITNGFYFEVFGNSNAAAAILSGTLHADNFRLSAAAPTTHTITVTDSTNASATNTFALTLATPVLTATTAVAAPTVAAGSPVAAFTPVTAVGGLSPRSFAIAPPLRAGLSFSPATGMVSGTPQPAAAIPSFVGGDDFNDGSGTKWAYSFRPLGGSNGTLAFANSRLEFTKAAGSGSYVLGWDGDPETPFSRTSTSRLTSWVADITVTNTFVAAAGEHAATGFQIGAQGQYSALMLTNGGGTLLVRAEGTGFGTAVTAPATTTTNVRLRLAWDAGGQVLRASYSFDGGTSFTQLATFSPLTQWTAGAAFTGFFFEVFGNSTAAAAIPSGAIYVDNFNVTATSPTTTAHSVVVTDASGLTATSAFNLTALPPVIVDQPVAQRAVAGGSVELRVGTASGAAVSYQWFKNGTALPGATDATLLLTRLTSADAGAYTVNVTHAAGVAASQPATLVVLAPDNLPWQQFTEWSVEHAPARTIHDGAGKVYVPWSAQDRIPDMLGGRYVGPLARLNESDGTLDGTFRLNPRYRNAAHVAVQPDGQLLVAVGGGDSATVIRVNASGTEQSSFTAPLFARGIRFITLQPDGKVLVAATDNLQPHAPAAAIGATAPTIFRLNVNGTLDSGFTPAVLGGTLPNLFGPPALDNAGRIYLAGAFGAIGGSNRINIARLNADGTLDDAYAKPGTAALPPGFASNQARAVVFQSNGRAVFVGDFRSDARGTASDPMMAVRFDAAGVFDATFARPLRSQLGLGSLGVRLRYALVDVDDAIVAVSDRAVRLNADGVLEGSSPPFANESFWISRDAAGRYYVPDQSGVMGQSTMISLVRNGIARLNDEGQPDPSFQTGGWGRVAYPTDAVVLPDGRAWVAGNFNRYGSVVAPGLVQLGVNGLPTMPATFAGADDFDGGTDSKWGYFFRLGGATTGTLAFTNSRLDFTKGAGAGNYFLGWDADGIASNTVYRSVSSFLTNWTMEVTATNLVASPANQFATIGLQASLGAGSYTALFLGNFGGTLSLVGETGAVTNQVAAPAGANATARLRLAWDAAARTLTGSYSFDGGATFTTLMTVPISQWSTSPATTGFSFDVFANSNLADAISTGQMRLDNFVLQAAGLPTTRSMNLSAIAATDHDAIFALLTTPGSSRQSVPAALLRVQPNGLVDGTFNPVPPSSYVLDSAVLHAAPGGKLLLAQAGVTAQAALNGATNDALVRLNPDGTRDMAYAPSFSSLGVVERDASNAVTMIRTGGVNVVQVLPNGGTLVVVTSVDGSLRLLRLTPSGAIDTMFNAPTFGSITPSVGFTMANTTDPVTNTTRQFPISNYSATDIVRTARQMPDGKVYVGGRLQLAGAPRGLVRLHPNGSLDTTFTGAGIGFSTAAAGPYVSELAVDAAGRLYVAGRFDSFNGTPAQGIFRLRANGTLDAWTPGFAVADAPRAAVRLLVAGNKLHAFGTVAVPGQPYPAVHASADIPPPPSILHPPAPATVNVGGTAAFSVTVIGDGPFTYQWLKDGTPISGATSSSLHLSAVSNSDIGAYSVAITGAGGVTVTTPVQLALAGAPLFTMQPRSQSVSAGQPFTLQVAVSGSGPFTYQWRKDGTVIAGATNATLSVSAAQSSDAGGYLVVASNSIASTSSQIAHLTVIPAGTGATHAVNGGGYVAGSTITITNTLTYTGTAAGLGWDVLLPDGWSFVSDSGTAGDTRPVAGQIGTIGWAWTNPPPSPITFSYTLNVPAGETGARALAAIFILRVTDSNVAQILARPDPLLIPAASTHDADTDHDFAINLFELTRVIELYNTRHGTARTGAYRVYPGTEDGFAPDATRAATETPTLTRYHSADTTVSGPRDGRIDLPELTRVIQLYNYRAGTRRTGQYRVSSDTEDGFAPGP